MAAMGEEETATLLGRDEPAAAPGLVLALAEALRAAIILATLLLGDSAPVLALLLLALPPLVQLAFPMQKRFLALLLLTLPLPPSNLLMVKTPSLEQDNPFCE